MAALSQSRLNVPLISACEDSEPEGSSIGSKTDQWYTQKETRKDSEDIWEQWDDRKDKPEELGPDSFQGSDLEGDDSRTKTGQCGFNGLWAPTGQGAGHGPNFCWWKTRGSGSIPFLGFPG